MTFWGRAIGFGVLMWLVPFVVAILVYGLHENSRALFESIMAVAVTASAVVLALLYVRRLQRNCAAEGLRVGILWLAIAVLIDAPLMLLGGPMKMSIAQYVADIGVTYLCIPAVTWGVGIARSLPDGEI